MKRAYPRLLVLAFVFCVGNIGFAQNSNSGDIRGTVTDSSGAVVPGANVTVTNNDTGVVNKYVTNRAMAYTTRVRFCPEITPSSSPSRDLQSFERGAVSLEVGIVTVDAVLKVGAATEVVEVNSDAPLLKTEDAAVTTTLQSEQLAELPNVDPENGWTYLLKLLPSATCYARDG